MKLDKNTIIVVVWSIFAIGAATDLEFGSIIPNQFIVVFNTDIQDADVTTHFTELNHTITSITRTSDTHPLSDPAVNIEINHLDFDGKLKGYTAFITSDVFISDEQLVSIKQAICDSPQVSFVEHDRVCVVSDRTVGGRGGGISAALLHWYGPFHRLSLGGKEAEDFVVQEGAAWNLVRLSHRTLKASSASTSYIFPDSAGLGTTVFVVDTGIDVTHPQIAGRATWGTSLVRAPNTTEFVNFDDNSHGTHVAGTIASTTYGVAKEASLVAVKVMDARGSGNTSTILAGLQWVLNNAKEPSKSIINTSLRMSSSRAIDITAGIMLNKGIAWAAAAGNQGADACSNSPNRVDGVMTVGAITWQDMVPRYSNQGPCVNIFAPGSNITSILPRNGFGVKSGTSMAAPMVSGLFALARSVHPELSSVKELNEYVLKYATYGVLDGLNTSTPNRLGYSRFH
ncbi:hypothetical protein SmJEL517_g04625 [Synchytrium microbalum]|uniref:Peptidase S8/S53 domain-containing protein n=1 Tax=Synchytrium microbalum TaxID=1806994 RepID=A0A507C2N8_9FUNG|nr:uncharacterized protein SmJEL517_g04625 [Synchytrium microbalum]TPX32216.1 hypothetical protein SmJEL517_g04625 [Synchytrium microbalum]